MLDTAERLNALNRRLTMLLGERRALEYRWTLAVTKANDWPDMRRAVELFGSIQPAADGRASDHTPALRSSSPPFARSERSDR
jgi:hypothetical protein